MAELAAPFPPSALPPYLSPPFSFRSFPLPLECSLEDQEIPIQIRLMWPVIFLLCSCLVVTFSLRNLHCLSLKLTSFRFVLLCSEVIVPRGKWIHVAMSWKRGLSGRLKLYANGEKKFEAVVDGNVNLDFRNSGRSVYNIGLRIDTGDTIKAYLSDLVIFNRELPEHELMEEWAQSHALYSSLFS